VRVRLSRPAREDIQQISDRVARGDPDRARSVAIEIRQAARSIGAAPFRCSPVIGSRIPGLRKKSALGYVLLFEVFSGEVLILRVVHERSDWLSLL
jgi:plasmid stabilization system protein ParE